MLQDEGQVWTPGPHVLGSAPSSLASVLGFPDCCPGGASCPGWLQVSMGLDPLVLLALFHRAARRLLGGRGASTRARAPSSPCLSGIEEMMFLEGTRLVSTGGRELGGSEAPRSRADTPRSMGLPRGRREEALHLPCSQQSAEEQVDSPGLPRCHA